MEKNKAAVTLARLRKESLTPERRKEIASKAAEAKWRKVGKSKAARREAVAAANSARRKSSGSKDNKES